MDGRDLPAFPNHSLRVSGGGFHLAADGAVHDGGDLRDHLLKIPSLFRDQGRICGNAADNAHVIRFSDLVYICCVNKKSHVSFPFPKRYQL